jgi:hypothetical protein
MRPGRKPRRAVVSSDGKLDVLIARRSVERLGDRLRLHLVEVVVDVATEAKLQRACGYGVSSKTVPSLEPPPWYVVP